MQHPTEHTATRNHGRDYNRDSPGLRRARTYAGASPSRFFLARNTNHFELSCPWNLYLKTDSRPVSLATYQPQNTTEVRPCVAIHINSRSLMMRPFSP